MVFSVAFAPYFEVNSLYGHVKPHWSGHFWGLVALVFQVSTFSSTVHCFQWTYHLVSFLLEHARPTSSKQYTITFNTDTHRLGATMLYF